MLLLYSTVLLAVIAANVVVALLVATIVGKDQLPSNKEPQPKRLGF